MKFLQLRQAVVGKMRWPPRYICDVQWVGCMMHRLMQPVQRGTHGSVWLMVFSNVWGSIVFSLQLNSEILSSDHIALQGEFVDNDIGGSSLNQKQNKKHLNDH